MFARGEVSVLGAYGHVCACGVYGGDEVANGISWKCLLVQRFPAGSVASAHISVCTLHIDVFFWSAYGGGVVNLEEG